MGHIAETSPAIRDLARAAIEAQDTYNKLWNTDTRAMSMDERIDHKLVTDIAFKATMAASRALSAAQSVAA